MPSLTTVTTPALVSPLLFALDVPDGWQQGRGAYGGFVLATVVRAIEAAAGSPERPLRTLTAELCAPLLTGPAEIRVEPLRTGAGTSTVAARAVQDGELRAHAVAVLARRRDPEPRYDGIAKPLMPPWRDVPPVPSRADGPFPAFAQHIEFRPTGPLPFSGSKEARASGWVRPRDPGPARDAAYLVALADAYWPAILPLLPAPRPMATITFTLDLVGDLSGLDPDAPVFHDSHAFVARDGYAPELRTIWGEDGRLLALNHQTFVVIR